jgi:hypothetical protein
VSSVNVKNWEGEVLGCKRFDREVQQYGGIFATRKEQHWPLAFGGYLTQNEYGVGF